MSENLRKLLGQKIREERSRRSWTIEELSEKADISPSFLGSVERGERALSIENLIKFSNILDVTVDSLLKETVSKNSRIDILFNLTQDFSDEDFVFTVNVLKAIKNYLGNPQG